MPTYDYLCHACGYRFEMLQSIIAEPIRDCPVCGEHQVRRLLTGGSGIIFKGSGFYITDYKKSAGDIPSNGPKEQQNVPKKTEA